MPPLSPRRDLHAGAPKVPEVIDEFIGEMQRALVSVTERQDVTLDSKSRFLRHARHTFGRTALVLSGGGALGCFHIVRPPSHSVHEDVLELVSLNVYWTV